MHGAWADGSSWAAVTDQLQREGYTVVVAPNPLRGIDYDSRYLEDYLATIAGPIVLVGHSYAGMVITAAAANNEHVSALVYVNAYIPVNGDTVMKLTASQPGSTLDPERSVTAVPLHDASGNTIDVDVYVKADYFGQLFVSGLEGATVAALAANQRPLTLSSLSEAFTGIPGWTTIPSWAFVGTTDQVIPPAAQQAMAKQANARVVNVDAPHLSMVTHPHAVADLIGEAVRGN
ncbi:alpha/beta hydrolase [Actinoplanes sp. TBRC 11911]|nr:alpha/beta hydrolase [Actinoplanes sp. TBRC 11911]NMO55403.1 alpha/beta hydrolase [Actinoplanes sp. TBRC 11911]